MGPRNAYKDMLDNVVSPITCVSMNHQNQLEQMANGVMFATLLLVMVVVSQCVTLAKEQKVINFPIFLRIKLPLLPLN
jgi:hypothetical protein